MESDLMKFRMLYKLKLVYRNAASGSGHESAADHSWSCLLLADYFLDRMKLKIDRAKVYQMLIYHDIVEIEVGDTPILLEKKRQEKAGHEKLAMGVLRKKLPRGFGNKVESLFMEFEEGKTIEARFAKAIDGMDAIIHELDYKKDWKNWDEKTLRRIYQERFVPFQEMMEAFEEVIELLYEWGWFRK